MEVRPLAVERGGTVTASVIVGPEAGGRNASPPTVRVALLRDGRELIGKTVATTVGFGGRYEAEVTLPIADDRLPGPYEIQASFPGEAAFASAIIEVTR
jgi:hypothetical protein